MSRKKLNFKAVQPIQKADESPKTKFLGRRFQLTPGVYEPYSTPRAKPYSERTSEEDAVEEKRTHNLFRYHHFRVKSSEQKDRGEYWEYVIVLTCGEAAEIVLRHATHKQYNQPNLPKLGEEYLFNLFAPDLDGFANASGSCSSEKSIPTLKPTKSED